MTARRTWGAVFLLVASCTVLNVFMPGDTLRGVHTGELPTLLVFLVVIAIGEQFRLEIPGRLQTSAVAAAAEIALAVTMRLPDRLVTYSSSEVVVTALGGQLCGLLILALRRRVNLSDPDIALDNAIRLFSVALSAAIARELPLFRGETLETASRTWPGWALALSLVVIGVVTGLIEVPLRSGPKPHLDGIWRGIPVDEIRATFSAGIALAGTGALVAMTVSVLGLVAVPMVLALLGLTDFAARRFVHVRETYDQSLRALSGMPEVVGYVLSGHAQRVSELSRLIAREMRLSERDVEAVVSAALIHDLGQLALRRPLPSGATVQAAPSDQQRIADSGAELIRRGGPLARLADLLYGQAVPYHRVISGGAEVPTGARIIKVANAFDDYGGRLGEEFPEERRSGMERIYLGLGYEYDPRVVDALTRVLDRLHPVVGGYR
ncbi:hypothetical protein KEM60_02992 [Austwickia sp. TVS 96-490-7B]|uniref:HD-GYP domain-containing protein n=1 Tax=Austwickia sp. TVS 96-490-7B TaxID=2830843 RepID=UPI001C5700DA|nr:HD domain-containing phosphohydrolase [Austwickia sp. TVS 96-490-7B]MBW3086763.1 hypothetical protein [Austwickia sp. TVS 96-490-7B]